jgi:PDZ domain
MKTLIIFVFFAAPLVLTQAAEPTKVFVCPDCGCASDSIVFDQPRDCPSCGMKLIEVNDQHKIETLRSRKAAVVAWPEGTSSVTMPFELLANCPYVQVRVNGKGPFLFEVDTGAYTVVASETVVGMSLQTSGTTTGSGAGSGAFTAGVIKDLIFEFPKGLRVPVNQAASPSMAALWPLIGKRIYGDIGFTINRNFVVEINYEKNLLTLYDPAKYHYAGNGQIMRFTSWANYDPQIDGQLIVTGEAPIPVKLTLDSGGGGTAITTPLAEAHQLQQKVGKVIPAFDNGIGGGEPKLVFARLAGLRVGSYLVNRPLVALTSDTEGSFASKTLGVNLGGNILRRFNVIIDYPHQELVLEPNSHLEDPFPADASGLILKAEGENFRRFIVRAVVPGSPATEAEIQPDDVLVAIDHEPLENYVLWQVQELLQKAGATYELSLERGGKKLSCKLRLRSLL